MIGAAYNAGMGRRYSLPELESNYRLWLSELLPKHFRSASNEQFAQHHDEFFGWGWSIQRGVLPSPPACLWIVNRAGNKSTSAAGLAVALGAMGRRKFGLVITRTDGQGDTHIKRVNAMLLASNVGLYYPRMAKPQVHEVGNRHIQAAWNRTQLTTDEGWTLQNFSLMAAQRGVGHEEYRPDFIWVTDIDDEHDSPGMVDTLADALAASVFGTRSSDCVVIFDQNVIHRDSVLNRILTRKTDVLSDRKVIGPIPAVRKPAYKRVDNYWVIEKGVPTWGGMPLPACEGTLNIVGMDKWEREYQHNTDKAYPDAVYPMWDEVFHIITWSEFVRFFAQQKHAIEWDLFDASGKPKLPGTGDIAMAQDWGNNPKHPCANRWVWQPSEGMPLSKWLFFYREMCWPRFPAVEADDRVGPSAVQVGKAIQDVEQRWSEGDRVLLRRASHERPEIIRGYAVDLPETGRDPLYFQSVDTSQAREGILHMQNILKIDESLAHPFRRYPIGHPDEGQRLRGCPTGAFFIVADGQGELYVDEATGELKATPATDERGQARTRFEYPNYRKPDTAQGDAKKDAPKRDDDMVDCDRALAGDRVPLIKPLTAEERLLLKWERRLDAQLQRASRNDVSEERIASIIQTSLINRERELDEAGRTGHYLTQDY